jgi:hypothetical protein
LINWWGIIWIFGLVFSHEWGHYIIAKKQGIYKGVAIIPFGVVAIQMTTYLQSRWDYLAGIATSSLAFPLFWLFEPTLRSKWWVFFVFALAIGIIDIVVFILYTPIIKDIDARLSRGEKVRDIPGVQIFGGKG